MMPVMSRRTASSMPCLMVSPKLRRLAMSDVFPVIIRPCVCQTAPGGECRGSGKAQRHSSYALLASSPRSQRRATPPASKCTTCKVPSRRLGTEG